MNKPIIAGTKPIATELVKDETKHFCTCGASVNQPFCDGKHKKTTFRPLGFKATKTGTAYLCMCKQSDNLPYCDGSHSKL